MSIRFPFYFLYAAMLRHSWAHFWHSSAHCLQWVSWNFAHSAPHASQIVAHKLQICLAYALSRAINWAAKAQKSMQSLSRLIQWILACTSGSFKHEVKHSSHACIHLLQASIQVWYCWMVEFTTVAIENFPSSVLGIRLYLKQLWLFYSPTSHIFRTAPAKGRSKLTQTVQRQRVGKKNVLIAPWEQALTVFKKEHGSAWCNR